MIACIIYQFLNSKMEIIIIFILNAKFVFISRKNFIDRISDTFPKHCWVKNYIIYSANMIKIYTKPPTHHPHSQTDLGTIFYTEIFWWAKFYLRFILTSMNGVFHSVDCDTYSSSFSTSCRKISTHSSFQFLLIYSGSDRIGYPKSDFWVVPTRGRNQPKNRWF